MIHEHWGLNISLKKNKSFQMSVCEKAGNRSGPKSTTQKQLLYKKIQLTGGRSQKTQEINPTANKADKEQMKNQNQGQKL